MGNALLPIDSIGGYEEQKPYYPFPVAVEKGLLDAQVAAVQPFSSPPGQEILHGRIPNSKQAGMVLVAEDHFVAFDHTAAEFHDRLLKIMPANKDAVSDDGEVQEPGMIILATDDGRLRIAALALNADTNPWILDTIRYEFPTNNRLGKIAIFAAGSLDFPEYEIVDVDNQTGIVTASPRGALY